MSKSGYNFIARLVHRLALQSKAITEISFDIENAITKNKDRVFDNNHVFISGLARSGTTILMQYLHEAGRFKSLTYRDMPFVLMPNAWKKIFHKKHSTEHKERAHQDGIMIGSDSPEAFEEVFWRTFCGGNYILNDRLQLYRVGDDAIEKFKCYVNNVLLSSDDESQTRYLSKNNNNVLRLHYLQKAFPQSHIIIPVREPLQQSISLLNQHMHFSKIQAKDKFSLNYMNWLGHFEFGLNQKSFYLNDENIFAQMQRYDKSDIDFWLLNWRNYYQYVNEHCTPNTIFFNYDKFCQNPSVELSALFGKLDINAAVISIKPFKSPVRSTNGFDKRIMEECDSIYNMLMAKAIE